ncbi:P-loop NTPase [Virgibacillus halophilus]|uniref:P-loop NTPase n=2 Tax=Tigheibacillus halophilus TaxID=361280 RepID=A0ABU5CCL0_9BACI|nr:P-loop NTPase [Virgibacillus halophilus]
MKSDQAANLRRQFQQTRKTAKTIVFVSGKGGVGKSNTALNFSMNLLKRGKRVLLMDMDIGMGNIEVLLGMQCRYSIIDFF